MLEPAGAGVLLPDTPAALTALVAICVVLAAALLIVAADGLVNSITRKKGPA